MSLPSDIHTVPRLWATVQYVLEGSFLKGKTACTGSRQFAIVEAKTGRGVIKFSHASLSCINY